MTPPRTTPRLLPCFAQRALLALALAGAAGAVPSAVPGGGAPLDVQDIEACKRRIAASSPSIDTACLRKVYARPIAEWPAPRVDASAHWEELAPLPKKAPEPADNPGTPEKIALGKKLFEDGRLSRSGQIACASCHDRQLGWGDGRSVSFGHDRQAGKRNAMNVSVSAFASPLFCDGRANTLEEQALHPIQDAKEMAFAPRELERRLNRDKHYRTEFQAAFGTTRIAMRQVAQALAAYERSLVPRFNRLDRFLEGNQNALNDQQLWGLHLFRTQARCMNCHSGPALTDNKFHNLGLHYYGRERQDLGRYNVTGRPEDAGKFRTPSLRGLEHSAPYMHNGVFGNLRGIVNLYNAGMPRPQPKPAQEQDPLFPREVDPLLKPLDLHKSELEALTAFLETL